MIDNFLFTKPPVSAAAVREFEQSTGVTIPPEFVELMSGPANGARPTPQDTFDVPTRRNNESDSVGRFLTLTAVDGREASTLADAFDTLKGRIPDETIPIATCGCGDELLLYWTGPQQGQIWIWDHEDEGQDNLYFVANSLHEFLDALYEYTETA
ncbi:MAG: SMI1/KNR4 family protein [Phycisphaerales bacterium JB054]